MSQQQKLKKDLTMWNLILMGVGGAIGSGVFVLTGIVSALHAGPAVILSFLLSGAVVVTVALTYASLSSRLNVAGGPYGFASTLRKPIFTKFVAWAVAVFYCFCVSVIAKGFSVYLVGSSEWLQSFTSLIEGGWINLPAALLPLAVIPVLLGGNTNFNKVNQLLIAFKMMVLTTFVIGMLPYFKPYHHWRDFFPYGMEGVIQGASILFLAFGGFDIIAASHGEAINPKKDVPRAIVISVLIVISIYVIIAIILTGSINYYHLSIPDALSYGLRLHNSDMAAIFVSYGTVISTTGAIVVFLFGYSRILYTLALGDMLPRALSKINRKHVPHRTVILSSIICSLVSGFLPLEAVANIGSFAGLITFTVTAICLIALQHTGKKTFTIYEYLAAIITLIVCIYMATQIFVRAPIAISICYALCLPIILGSYGKISVLSDDD